MIDIDDLDLGTDGSDDEYMEDFTPIHHHPM